MNSEIYDLGKDSFGKRVQSLLDVITTAGDDAQSKPCYTEESYAKHILEGVERDESYFVMIRELDQEDNPHDEGVWLPNRTRSGSGARPSGRRIPPGAPGRPWPAPCSARLSIEM